MGSGESLLNMAVLGKLLFGLALVLGILAALVFLLRFLQRKKLDLSGVAVDMKIVHTTHLSPKQKLTLIHWDKMQYLIALTAEGGFLVDKKTLNPAPVPSKKGGA